MTDGRSVGPDSYQVDFINLLRLKKNEDLKY